VTPHYADDSVTLYAGDCIEVMRELPDASVDAVVTDPPYDLTSGGKGGFMGKEWDGTGIAFRPDVWRECLRVLKPGGHLLAFGGTRTWHRLACAIEDAGFEVRDSIAWMYGSGFPKSLDVSKAIDKAAGAEREVVGVGQYADRGRVASGSQVDVGDSASSVITAPATPDAVKWQGWGTALKPAFEPIVVARKPLIGTVSANVLAHGTGALNVDGCRIAGEPVQSQAANSTGSFTTPGPEGPRPREYTTAGRWPANVILDESQAEALDRMSGDRPPGRPQNRLTPADKFGGDSYGDGLPTPLGWDPSGYTDTGGTSRFFYTAKADATERPRVDGVAHPTVKPLDLMRYLVRLVCPPGGVVLEPFAGSGTTAEACIVEGFKCIAIEREADYLPLILQRITKPIEVTLL
jgi:site-specific DNA-methyltransferase (adenine-specific)